MTMEGRLILLDNIQWECTVDFYHLIPVLTFECTMTLGFSNLRCFGWNL